MLINDVVELQFEAESLSVVQRLIKVAGSMSRFTRVGV